MPNEREHIFFFYGSLMKGYGPLGLVIDRSRWRRIGHGRIKSIMYDLGGYPGAIRTSEPNQFVYGEVYAIPDVNDVIPKLDEYEEFYPNDHNHSLFVREVAKVEMNDGKEINAMVYFYNREPRIAHRILSGRWGKNQQ